MLSNCLFSAFSQSNFDGLWTDGGQNFRPFLPENGLIQFEGGTLHEGGSMFYGQIVSDNTIRILGRTPEDSYSPSYGNVNDQLEYKKIGIYELLILSDSNGKIKSILQKYSGSFRDIVVNNKINHQLSGKYRHIGSDEVVSFTVNKPTVSGLKGGTNYEFETEYDFPLDVIALESVSYWYENGNRTLGLFKVEKTEYGEFEKGEEVMKLTLLENYPVVATELKGDYTFASTIPLIDNILFLYNLEELRLIRNEIFARYGYKFKSEDLQTFFKLKDWYIPNADDVTNKLTELEKLNVQLILNVEERKRLLNASNQR
tara:strand:- start:2800 stop:3744 length:945 start_codon:yes stop_codon:yes gene_type:complete